MLTLELTLIKIGELAQKSGVPIQTIRYYEELGLLKSERRTEGNFRLFTTDIINRLHFIKRLQLLGLSLEEIGQCLEIADRGELPCPHIKDKLDQQIEEVDTKIAELMLLRQQLTDIAQQWSFSVQCQPNILCPNLQI